MDDLLGEDWQKPAKPVTSTPSSNPTAFASNYSSLRVSPQPPLSGTSTPSNISRPSSTVNGSPRTGTGDAFGSLTSLRSQKGRDALSMQERQKQMVEEKRRQQEQQNSMWDNLGSGRGTPEIRRPSPAVPQDDEDDILAAFNKDAPVNNASYFMPPSSSQVNSGRSTPATAAKSPPPVATGGFDDDDDPFGLDEMSKKSNGHSRAPAPRVASDEDDILGDLGRPAQERPARSASPEEPMLELNSMSSVPPEPEEDNADPRDRPLAELVDMGFPADTARIAMAENGGNVQSAVGWLLQQAHEESRQKARGEQTAPARQSRQTGSTSPQRRQRTGDDGRPAWMRHEGRSDSASRQRDNASPANGERDPAQMAQEFGSKFLKSAGSIWKASQKQMAKTMAEFQQDSDPSRPKWMRDASVDSAASPRRQTEEQEKARRQQADMTNEAALLDAPRERPQKPQRPSASERPVEAPSRGRSPVERLPHRPSPQPKFTQQAPPPADRRPTSKLSRQDVEEQSAQAYVSPARRKRPTPKPEPAVEPEVDLFSPAPVASSATQQAASASRPTPVSSYSPAPVSVRPKAPPRNVPSISPSALSTSASHRKKGGEHYKRGDYGAAHEAYTAALTPLPSTHPIAIVVLSNRSLTALKTGDAKVAVADADRALDIIGSGLGVGETIEVGGGENAKDMKEFYGKALMRKAEALEHMEKYSDAAAVWRLAVEAGVGGTVSLRGRDRCEKAARPKPPASSARKAATSSSAPRPGKTPPAKSLGNSMQRPTLPSASSGAAVKKLREANAAAEKADDEKFALSDSVDAKLAAWKGGKTDNLRALLQSMDIVLWESAGWKKVGMSDLVMPNKVKIVYMKAIGKVHPDKVSQPNASSRNRYIMGSKLT